MTFVFSIVLTAVSIVCGIRVVKLAVKAIGKLFDTLEKKL